jgi:hypothetical protein
MNEEINKDKVEDLIIENKNLILIIISCLLMSVIITIIHNTNISIYLRDVIIPFGLMLIGYIFLIKKCRVELNIKAYILLIPITLILLSDVFIGIDMSNKLLNVFMLPVLILTFFLLLINKNFKITKDSFNWLLELFPKNIFNNFKYIDNLFNSISNNNIKTILNILLGSIIGLPIAAIILCLLANADKYFSEFISFAFNAISRILTNRLLFTNLLLLIVIFVILYSIFINLLRKRDSVLIATKNKDLNHIIGSTILVIVNIIFILFLISEISKITNNFLQLPIEYTYAEYAREGFFQLLMVTMINFAILIYYIYFSNIIENNKFVKNLILLLISFSIILIFNSYYRMFLYIGAYGFTVLRLQVILFLAMELILFATIAKKIIGKLEYDDAIIFLVITLSFYILNSYLCIDKFAKLLNNVTKLGS